MLCQRIRSHILGCLVDARSFIGMLWPIGCKYLKCLAPQQQIKWPAHLLGHDLPQEFIEVRNGPSATRKVATSVFGGPAGCLHDAVERYESQHNDFSHAICPPN